ncbi:DUF4396 domain-containing protein [Actinotalea sp. M2MS4P-6]|uniref:DUF4396 domain-containing protein n=1 Tax=Actinotalea sp. M2MS4P-6 TaxID=2983762 RepID=UPI0021E4EC25|nr:DUF4396 domain-containing protein [Actinotalea sp. M2MS4P-6]MCV2396288.1 DUF4396 domain-containing protein [Actinotalea sp. M2MS4P-6]
MTSSDPLTLADLPTWSTVVSGILLGVGVVCSAWVTLDVVRHPPRMRVMAVVWPVTMLFGGLLWLWFYLRWGRATRRGETPMRVSVATGASHCGAGCALGDMVGETLLVLVPALATAVGLGTLYSDDLYARWIVDFVAAYLFGIAFQYAALAPMRGGPRRAVLWQAVKADTWSITSWQVGMYGVMGLAQLLVLPTLLGGRVAVSTPQFWAVMQVAMLAGFATAYPVNWWLIRRGVKEAM